MSSTQAVKSQPSEENNTTLAAGCERQIFSQPFLALGDANYYTLAPGATFNSGPEGWQLYHGARVVQGTRPDGSTGGVLDLPGGAMAISPPVCVTLLYPDARVWERNPEGAHVAVLVGYQETQAMTTPTSVGQIGAKQVAWTLSEPFEVSPELGGKVEGAREARFVFIAGRGHTHTQLYGLYVDPRMR